MTSSAQSIGSCVKAFRESLGVTQEDVAAHARKLGLKWSRTTLARIESGDRKLTAEELLLMPAMLQGEFDTHSYFRGLLDVLGDGAIRLSAQAEIMPKRLRTLLINDSVGANEWEPSFSMWSWALDNETPEEQVQREQEPEALALARLSAPQLFLEMERVWKPEFVDQEIASEAYGEAERKVARRFGLHPIFVVVASRERWSRPLTYERNARLTDEDRQLEKRSLQARLGVITRLLIRELTPRLLELASKK